MESHISLIYFGHVVRIAGRSLPWGDSHWEVPRCWTPFTFEWKIDAERSNCNARGPTENRIFSYQGNLRSTKVQNSWVSSLALWYSKLILVFKSLKEAFQTAGRFGGHSTPEQKRCDRAKAVPQVVPSSPQRAEGAPAASPAADPGGAVWEPLHTQPLAASQPCVPNKHILVGCTSSSRLTKTCLLLSILGFSSCFLLQQRFLFNEGFNYVLYKMKK